MRCVVGQSSQTQAEACVNEVTKQFINPKVILYFSPTKQFEEYTRLLHERFPDSICMGATIIEGITKNGASKQGLTAMALGEGIKACAGVLEDADTYPIKYAGNVKDCVQKIGSRNNTICLEFTTAFCCAEESVLSVLNSVLMDYDIPLIGGSAGNDTTDTITYVGLNGKVYSNSCVFALIHNEKGAIHFFRENIYKPMNDHILVATKVDHVNRIVREYNHEPAAKVFARELGVADSQISKYFDTHPMGRIFGKHMYITANCAEVDGKGMSYHARIYNNSQTVVLEPDDYRRVVQETMEKIRQEVPRPSFSIMCHCLARTLLFEGDGYMQEYAKTMGTVLGDYVGFSGYGEQLRRQQLNQTMIVAVFE